jgi:hypothetical protein
MDFVAFCPGFILNPCDTSHVVSLVICCKQLHHTHQGVMLWFPHTQSWECVSKLCCSLSFGFCVWPWMHLCKRFTLLDPKKLVLLFLSQHMSNCVADHMLFQFPYIYDTCTSYQVLEDMVHVVAVWKNNAYSASLISSVLQYCLYSVW